MKMRRLLRGYLSPLVLCILFLAACGSPQVGIERTPMPDHAATATVAAVATESARLTTQKATVPTPTPSPPLSRPMGTNTDLALIYHLDGTIYYGDLLGAEAMPKASLREPLSPEALWSARLSDRFLAYVLGNRFTLIDLESGEIRTLHSIEQPNVMGLNFVWSSDGGALAYAASYDDPQAAFGFAVEVGVIDVEKGESQVVTTLAEWAGALVVGYDRASGKVWLIPRGQDPAFVEVHVYDVEQPGSSPRLLSVVGYGYAVAAPDLSRLAVMDYEEQALTKVYSLLDPTVPPLVLRHPKGTFGAHYLWSERHLAYVALEGAPWGEQTGGADGIWVWKAGAKEPRRVAEATGKDDAPIAWMPDGAWLLVRQTPPGGSPRYAVVPLEGGEPIRLQVPSRAQVLGWTSTLTSAYKPTPSTPIPGPVATYIDAEIGCTLDYPAEWHIQATPGWLVVITSFDPAGAPGIGGVPPDKAKVDLAPDKPGQTKSLEELVAEVYTEARNREVLEVLWEECWELAKNVPAVRMQVKGQVGGEMALLLTVLNGRSLRLAGYGDTSLFDGIARTLRPIPLAEAPFSLSYRYQRDSSDVLHLPGSCRQQ